MWYLWNRQMMKFNSTDKDEVAAIRTQVQAAGRIVDRVEASNGTVVFLMRDETSSEVDIYGPSDRRKCLELPPTVFSGGRGIFRFAGFQEEDVKGIFDDIAEQADASLVRKRTLPLNVIRSSIWISSVFSSLTSRQADSLIMAGDMGYCESPRMCTTQDVSASMGITRSTLEEHLKKAENILINTFVPYLKLFHSYGDQDKFYHSTLEPPEELLQESIS